jgi:hypothetical protein
MKRAAAAAALLMVLAAPAVPYSVLTHQAVIDTDWKDGLEPALRARFPKITAGELRRARAYAYGGSIVQDMGYYPFGNKFFSDLTHYVRSGEFVMRMLEDAADSDEYAFALGALAHYVSDTEGHPLAVNVAVGVEYPELAARYGKEVTYADNPQAHAKTEFGFDVLQVARGHYAPEEYYNLIGFEVAQKLLERSFAATYSLELKEVFTNEEVAIGTFRWAVRNAIPQATKVAWTLKEDELVNDTPGLTRRKFIYNLKRADYERQWGRGYRRPGVGTRVLAFFVAVLPKVGPLHAIEFKAPTAQTSKLFMESFNQTVDIYGRVLEDVRRGRLHLANRDFDTGKPTSVGEYRLADETYAKLARKLAEAGRNPGEKLRADVLAFFAQPEKSLYGRKHKREWKKTLAAVEILAGGRRSTF